jgi:hypothetical protein
MLASLLQGVGLGVIITGGFVIAFGAGLVAVGAAVVYVGLALEQR